MSEANVSGSEVVGTAKTDKRRGRKGPRSSRSSVQAEFVKLAERMKLEVSNDYKKVGTCRIGVLAGTDETVTSFAPVRTTDTNGNTELLFPSLGYCRAAEAVKMLRLAGDVWELAHKTVEPSA